MLVGGMRNQLNTFYLYKALYKYTSGAPRIGLAHKHFSHDGRVEMLPSVIVTRSKFEKACNESGASRRATVAGWVETPRSWNTKSRDYPELSPTNLLT